MEIVKMPRHKYFLPGHLQQTIPAFDSNHPLYFHSFAYLHFQIGYTFISLHLLSLRNLTIFTPVHLIIADVSNHHGVT